MKLHLWGTRGSSPISANAEEIRTKIKRALQAARGWDLSEDSALDPFLDQLPFSISGTFGGCTTCYEIQDPQLENKYLLFDAGTGLREFGKKHKAEKEGIPSTFHIFMSHVHWDHIQGFPFFVPAYEPGNRIVFHGHHLSIPDALRYQSEEPFFPLPLSGMAAEIEFDIQPPGTAFSVGGFHITTIHQRHPGVSFGYRFEKDGKVIVISTDSEHQDDVDDEHYPFIEFFRDADVVVFDAQYTFAEATILKKHWGHSSNVVGVELCKRARVKNLCMVHHDPNAGDEWLEAFQNDTQMYRGLYTRESDDPYPENVYVAYDSLSIPV